MFKALEQSYRKINSWITKSRQRKKKKKYPGLYPAHSIQELQCFSTDRMDYSGQNCETNTQFDYRLGG